MSLAAALAAIGACAATAVVALAFTLYALLRDPLSPAGASACVAGAACLLAGVLALVAYRQVVPFKRRPLRNPPPPPMSFMDRAVDVVRERPIVAAGAALAVGFIALRNPLVIATIVRALTERPRNPR